MLAQLERYADNIVVTRYPGHAAELASGVDADCGIAAVGGDGTLFEILKGLDHGKHRIALVPAGRGNSLARDLGLVNGGGMLTAMHWDEARRIDLMEVKAVRADGGESTHISASTVAIGYPAEVVVTARKMAVFGRMSYAAAATVTRPLHFQACVQYDQEEPSRVRLSGFVANNTRHMANFVVFGAADCCDGRFDVMEMNAGLLKQSMHNAAALSGTDVYRPYAPRQASVARVQLDLAQTMMLDGEVFPGVVRFEVRLLPGALECNGPKAQA